MVLGHVQSIIQTIISIIEKIGKPGDLNLVEMLIRFCSDVRVHDSIHSRLIALRSKLPY